jgi:hypothetical protein
LAGSDSGECAGWERRIHVSFDNGESEGWGSGIHYADDTIYEGEWKGGIFTTVDGKVFAETESVVD